VKTRFPVPVLLVALLCGCPIISEELALLKTMASTEIEGDDANERSDAADNDGQATPPHPRAPSAAFALHVTLPVESRQYPPRWRTSSPRCEAWCNIRAN